MLLDKIKQLAAYDIVENPKHYAFALVITLLSLLVMLFEPVSSEWLRYQAVEVSNGQWWRAITANLVHSNWNHWLLNMAGLWLMDLFFQPVLSLKLRSGLLSFCMLLNVLMLHFLMTVSWYVGLSGALHGYLVGAALLSWNTSKLLNFAILSVTAAKLIAENLWQINSATEKLINSNVLEEAHLFGAVAGIAFWLLYQIKRLKRTPV